MKREWEMLPPVEAVIQQRRAEYPRLKEMVVGICRKLAADPQLGAQRPNTPVFVYVADPVIDDLPRVVALYQFNARKLLLRSILLTPATE